MQKSKYNAEDLSFVVNEPTIGGIMQIQIIYQLKITK